MSITEFLNARIAEDEAVARAAIADGEGAKDWAGMDSDTDAHIARHDPARVLAECAAKRAMLNLIDVAAGMDSTLADEDYGFHDIEDKMLRTLAAVYADHEDFRDEWRVGA